MTYPLIGLIGKKRSGKDTLAETLVADFGYTRVALADPLKEAALGLDPIMGTFPLTFDGDRGPVTYTEEWRLSEVIAALGWERAKDYVPEARRTLQRLGTESIRSLDDGFWLRQAATRYGDRTAPVVVTDVRYPNEAESIIEHGGVIVRVLRSATDTATDRHPSEVAMDDYPEDLTILNDGALADLADSARLAHNFASID